MDAPELKLGKWQDKTTYGCPYCRFDSTDEATALVHVYERHTYEPQPKPQSATLFDPHGRLVTA